jgi:predicted nucleotidyltransferase
MTIKDIKKVLTEFKGELNSKFSGIEGVYLYGSVARNQHTSESDIDILIITDEDLTGINEEKILDMAYVIGLKYNCVFGVIVCSVRGWDRLKSVGSPFYAEVKKEAVKI